MLEKISKQDDQWRRIALRICGNKTLADDLVNDMYMKVHKVEPKTFNTSFITCIIYRLFLDHIKTIRYKKTSYLEELINFNHLHDEFDIEDRQRLNNSLDELGLIDREILLITHEKSLRKASTDLHMSYGKLNYIKKNALIKLQNTEAIKTWRNER